jgi:hypothetical protein
VKVHFLNVVRCSFSYILPRNAERADRAYASSGVLWGGAFHPRENAVRWHQFKAEVEGLQTGTHLQFFFYTSDRDTPPPDPNPTDPIRPFDPTYWQAMPLDRLEGLILGEAKRYLWIGVHFTSEGQAIPRVELFSTPKP